MAQQLWGLLLNFNWLVQTYQSLIVIYSRGDLCIMIVDVHQFNGKCLIPLKSLLEMDIPTFTEYIIEMLCL